MKTVFPNRQVSHVWAAQTQQSGRGSNIFFEDRVIYSYGRHFPLAVFSPFRDAYGRAVVIFNGESRSMTTGRHQSQVRAALRDHRVTVVAVDGLSDGTAQLLADGYASQLPNLAHALQDEAEKLFSGTLNRRDPWRIAHAFERIAELRETVQSFADYTAPRRDMKPAALRRDLARIVADFPTLPGFTWRDEAGNLADVAPLFRDFLRGARKERERERAQRDAADAVQSLRHHWKGARNAYANGPRLTAAQCLEHANAAADLRARLDVMKKRHDIAIPGNLPTSRTIAALILKTKPAASAEKGREESDKLRAAYLAHVHAFYSARREREAYSRCIIARTILDGGRWNYETLRGFRHLAPILERVAALDPSAATSFRDLIAAAETREDARATLAAMQRDARAFLAFIASAERVALAWFRRDAVASRRGYLVTECAKAADADASPDTLRNACKAFDLYEETRAAYLADYPHHAGGRTMQTPSGCDPEAWRARVALAGARYKIATLETNAGSVRDCIRFTLDAVRTGKPFSAARHLSAATGTFTNSRDAMPRAADDLAAAPGDGADLAALRARLDALRATWSALDGELSAAESAVIAARDAMTARAANAGDSLELAAWRAGDSAAPTPRAVAFRLAANGEIESSMGARVSVAAGRRLWALMRAVVASGQGRSWGYAEGPRVGAFHLEAIFADGSAKVGCHNIAASEARAFARIMQWPPFGAPTDADALPDLDNPEAATA